ncbi:ribosome biogenesis protein sqt1 [Ophiostoma piceae UAMH 11346]|uniref:Ribosome biogenesis protein sqt1 n=1 Tax=Ophiostoma piceae (strain UAMH 11346) TaxID=1262450 RepID=S3CPD8_OPHP1|nr:ribosome biogenesis protein sqt1 [Ophiostoma piceae UAMH 11346]
MSNNEKPYETGDGDDSEPEMLAVDDALEEIDDGEDIAMASDDEHDDGEDIYLVNDSIAYFDVHKDSVFAIAQHPKYPSLVATGGSEGDGDDAPGKGYVIDTSAAQSRPLLPFTYSSDPEAAAAQRSTELQPLFTIDGHTDSINALTFTLPNGDFLVSGGMDGRMRVYGVNVGDGRVDFQFVAESQEVPEINWLVPSPSKDHPNTLALGASDGSVWVFTIDPAADPAAPVQIAQSYFMHMGACTAGAWTPDGNLLATVSEDGSLNVWDVWGVAAGKGLLAPGQTQTVVSLTSEDQRFEVIGGLYSVAVSPGGGVVAVGGAGGIIKIVSLPRLADAAKPAAGKGKAQKGRAGGAGEAQAGMILASMQAQSDGVEALSFAPPPLTLLAAGSVDGSIAVYDASRSFAVRRHIQHAHDDYSVVKVEWVRSSPQAGGVSGPAQWLLTSCGMDGVVRRWDVRGTAPTGAASSAAAAAQATAQGGAPGPSAAATASGLVKEWRGHRGDGEGGGVLGFVQGETGERVVTAGDDGVVLVFEA